MTREAKEDCRDEQVDRWNEGLENHEKLKRILPFLNDEEGYL